MVWVRLDDSFFENRKVVALSIRAKLLFLAGLTHAAKHLTDGHLLDADVLIVRVYADAGAKQVHELVNANLWERDGSGYLIHDWSDYNAPAEKLRAERAAAKERMRLARSGEQPVNVPANVPANVQDEVPSEVRPDVPRATRNPSPVARNPSPKSSSSSAPPSPAGKDTAPSGSSYDSNPVLAQAAQIYEQEIGALTPLVESRLVEAVSEYSAECIRHSIAEAAKNNKRSWAYVEAILKRHKAEGCYATARAVPDAEAARLQARYERGKAT